MGDPLQPANPGDGLSALFRADTFNLHQEVARWYRDRKGGDTGAPVLNLGRITSKLIIWVRAPAGTHGLDAWSVVTPTGIAIDPETVPLKANDNPVFDVTDPLPDQPFFVTVEPIAPGKLGRAVASGVVVVRVDISDPAHQWARPVPGDPTQLRSSAANGPARILSRPGVGSFRCMVLLGEGMGTVVDVVQITEAADTTGLQRGRVLDYENGSFVPGREVEFFELNGGEVPVGVRLNALLVDGEREVEAGSEGTDTALPLYVGTCPSTCSSTSTTSTTTGGPPGTTTTTTFGPCSGGCDWVWNSSDKVWELASSSCCGGGTTSTTTTGGTGETTTTGGPCGEAWTVDTTSGYVVSVPDRTNIAPPAGAPYLVFTSGGVTYYMLPSWTYTVMPPEGYGWVAEEDIPGDAIQITGSVDACGAGGGGGGSGGCDCKCTAPDFCPPISDYPACVTTVCRHAQTDETPPNCTGTTTTFGPPPECTTTTTTPGCSASGSCIWFCHPVRGWITTLNECLPPCSACPRPDHACNSANFCETVVNGCPFIPPPPPPPLEQCIGYCTWIWVPGEGWHYDRSKSDPCRRTLGTPVPCACGCDRPEDPEEEPLCGAEVRTYCYFHCPPTTTTTRGPCDPPPPDETTTTAGPGSCAGECLYYANGENWSKVSGCIACGCAAPLHPPASPCEYITTPCSGTTTTPGPTTTTTAGPTTTTTTTEGPGYGCYADANTECDPMQAQYRVCLPREIGDADPDLIMCQGPYPENADCTAVCFQTGTTTTTTGGPTSTTTTAGCDHRCLDAWCCNGTNCQLNTDCVDESWTGPYADFAACQAACSGGSSTTGGPGTTTDGPTSSTTTGGPTGSCCEMSVAGTCAGVMTQADCTNNWGGGYAWTEGKDCLWCLGRCCCQDGSCNFAVNEATCNSNVIGPCVGIGSGTGTWHGQGTNCAGADPCMSPTTPGGISEL